MNYPEKSDMFFLDTTKPIQVQDSWVTWPGKDIGLPRPKIVWYGLEHAGARTTNSGIG
jgi:hypothetical protein